MLGAVKSEPVTVYWNDNSYVKSDILQTPLVNSLSIAYWLPRHVAPGPRHSAHRELELHISHGTAMTTLSLYRSMS
jgi:hypothetical protein